MRSWYFLFIQSFEEMSRQENTTLGYLIRGVLFHTLADRLWTPFKAICYNPLIAAGVVLVLYLVFCIIFLPLMALSYLITSYGSFAVFVLLFHLLAVYITRNIAFAGSSTMAQKQLSADVIRRISYYLENVAVSTNEYTSMLMLVASGQLSASEIGHNIYNIDQIWQSVQFLPNINNYIKDAVEALKTDTSITADEKKVFIQLCNSMPDFFVHFQQLLILILKPNPHHPQQRPRLSITIQQIVGNQQVLSVAGKCLKASEILRISCVAIRPVSSNEEDGGGAGISGLIKALLSFQSNLTGFEKLSFPYMRSILQRKFHAKSISIVGGDGNSIDAIHFTASAIKQAHSPQYHQQQQQQQHRTNSTENESRVKKMVLFCSPNAGFYECVSQADIQKSWFGFYAHQGYDLFMFNYRGYGRSSGTPTPQAVKADALKVVDYIRTELNPEMLIVHGESIGGMIACHIAKHVPIDGLVCDRTFASLDAAACRLMGNWAGTSMRWLSFWQTNVVTDFLAAKCRKLILQDPNDEIIADPASLRTGLASSLMLNEQLWAVPSEPQEYLIARYLKDHVPTRERGELLLKDLSASDFVSLDFVTHFFACCSYVSQHQSGTSGSSVKVHTDDGGNLASKALSKIELIQSKGGLAGDDHGLEMNLVRNNSRSSEESSSGMEEDPQDQSKSPQERLERLQKFKMDDQFFEGKIVTPMKKAWLAIMRIDGGFGQLLGASLAKGLDGTKSWLASYIVWNRNTSAFMKNGVKSAIDDLKSLMQSLHKTELEHEYAIQFVIDSLEGLYQRNVRFVSEGCPAMKNFSSTDEDVQGLLGTLIPLHCGHNGWPSDFELEMVSSWFEALEAVQAQSSTNSSLV